MGQENELKKMLQQGQISRREFINRISALGLVVAISPGMMVRNAVAATPKKGGRFRMGLEGGATTDSLDTATIDDVLTMHVNYACRNTLVEIDADGNPIPELAESWDASSDAARWTFHLRKGVEFHNDRSLEAEDVIFSINHHRGADSKSGAKGFVDQITEIKADGKDKIIFKLSGGNADFPFVLSDFHLTVVPAGTKGNDWERGMGTGGYIVQDWQPGVRAYFKRNPNYFKSDRAHFDEVDILSVPDVNSRTNALKTGQIDYMNRAELKTVHLLEKDPNLRIIRAVGGFHYTFAMHTDVAPYDNKDVRLALKYAVDRQQLVKSILRGYGTVGNDHPIAPNMRFHNSKLSQRIYDPDKARFHLKKAGLQNHTFELFTSDLGGFLDIAVMFKEHAAKAGIKININKEPKDGYWSNVWLKKPFCNCYWGARPTEDMMFSVGYAGDADWNDTHFKHKRFDELVVKARAELDDQKRAAMYAECQKILNEEGGTIVAFFKDYVEAASKKIQTGKIAGNWECDGSRAAERWWFA